MVSCSQIKKGGDFRLIELKNVTKKYGNLVAVDNISFDVKNGEIIGLLGQNGAGKSTTMNMITGFIEPTQGNIIVNGRAVEEYFNYETLIRDVKQPLVLTNNENKYDVIVKVEGGGFTGQAGAIRHGISRALLKADAELRGDLKKEGFLTRDARMKERKKYGLKAARRAPQFSKR